jgi:hypothetical protein
VTPRPSYFLNGISLATLGFQPDPADGGRRHGITLEVRGVTLPGIAGTLDDGAPRQASARTITIAGTVRGATRTECLERIRTILALAGRGQVELRAIDANDRVILVERDGAAQAALHAPSLLEDDGAQRTGTLTLRFRAAEPAWRDREPQILAIGQTAVPCPLGHLLASPWTLEIFGSDLGVVTNPQVIYEDAGGNVQASVTLTGTLDWGTDATARYWLSTEGVAPRIRKLVTSSWTDTDAHLTAGRFFALSPLDGWTGDAAYPRVRLFDADGRATGLLTYFRRWEL